MAYVVNRVVPTYATIIYSQPIFERCLISVLYFQNRYIPFTHRKWTYIHPLCSLLCSISQFS